MRTTLRLLSLLKPFTGWVLLSVFLAAASIASGIGLLGTSAYLISQAALHPSIAVLQVAIVGVRFFGLSRGIFRYLERLTSHSVNFRLLAQLRVWVFNLIEPRVPGGLPGVASGDLLTRITSDVDTLENFYVRVVAPFTAAGLTVIAMGFFVSQFDRTAAVILSVGMLICGILIPILTYWIGRGPGKAMISARSKLSVRLVESIQGISDLTAFDRLTTVEQGLNEANQALQRTQFRQVWSGAWVNSGNNLITNLTMAAVLWVAIPLVSSGILEGFLLPVLVILVSASFEAVTPLALASQMHASTQEAGDRLLAIENYSGVISDPDIPIPMPERLRDLTFDKVSFSYYEDASEILDRIDLQLQPGEKVALVGPTGAGKTTLTNLLMRFWDYTQGEILLNGKDLHQYNATEVRSQFTVISQSPYLFNASLRQNLLIAEPGSSQQALLDAIQNAGLGEWLNGLPSGLDTWVGEHGLRLSGGERQRIAVARALLRDTPFVILDEPTAHLDASTEFRLVEQIHSAFKGKSMVWITHRLVGMERMDTIIVMDHGRIIERGTHTALIKTGGFYARLWELQCRNIPLTFSSPQSW